MSTNGSCHSGRWPWHNLPALSSVCFASVYCPVRGQCPVDHFAGAVCVMFTFTTFCKWRVDLCALYCPIRCITRMLSDREVYAMCVALSTIGSNNFCKVGLNYGQHSHRQLVHLAKFVSVCTSLTSDCPMMHQFSSGLRFCRKAEWAQVHSPPSNWAWVLYLSASDRFH